MRFTDRLRLLVLVLLISVVHLPAEGQEPGRPGYLITFSASETGCELSSAVLIENYAERRQTADPDDWTVLLEDEAEDIFWQASVPNPRRLLPMRDRQESVSFTVRIPALSSPILRLRDEHGEVRFRMVLDETFVNQARANQARFQGLEEQQPRCDQAVERAESEKRAGTVSVRNPAHGGGARTG